MWVWEGAGTGVQRLSPSGQRPKAKGLVKVWCADHPVKAPVTMVHTGVGASQV